MYLVECNHFLMIQIIELIKPAAFSCYAFSNRNNKHLSGICKAVAHLQKLKTVFQIYNLSFLFIDYDTKPVGNIAVFFQKLFKKFLIRMDYISIVHISAVIFTAFDGLAKLVELGRVEYADSLRELASDSYSLFAFKTIYQITYQIHNFFIVDFLGELCFECFVRDAVEIFREVYQKNITVLSVFTIIFCKMCFYSPAREIYSFVFHTGAVVINQIARKLWIQYEITQSSLQYTVGYVH